MIEYNQRILQTSASPQRRHRAERMLMNLQQPLAALERREGKSGAPQPSSTRLVDGEEFEVVWNG